MKKVILRKETNEKNIWLNTVRSIEKGLNHHKNTQYKTFGERRRREHKTCIVLVCGFPQILKIAGEHQRRKRSFGVFLWQK